MSNNSILLERDKITLGEFESIMENVKAFGEPGFIFTDSKYTLFNPLKLAA